MRYLFLALISAVFTITVSGCAYNASYAPTGTRAHLTGVQMSKLNGIMFAYLDIPAAKFSSIAPPRRRPAGNFYQPAAVVKAIPVHAPAVKPKKEAKAKTGIAAVKKTVAASAVKNRVQPKAYGIIVLNDTLYLKIYSKNLVRINKNYRIGNVFITVENIKCDKGYEIVQMAIENKGGTKTVMENFKYSNAGNSFGLKKFEIIQNLTVANKYKEGMTLWVKF